MLTRETYLSDASFLNFVARNNFALFRDYTVAITGANGMIASALATLVHYGAEANGFECKELILISRNWKNSALTSLIKNPKVKVYENTEPMESIKPEVIFHLASPSNSTKYNDLEELIEANSKVMHSLISDRTIQVIYISSGEVYGKGDTNEDVDLPRFNAHEFRSFYPLAKIQSEIELLSLSKKFNFEAKIIRLFHTFGPGVKENDGRSFADILWGAIKFRKILLKSNGSQIRSFLYITDAIEALLQIANKSNIKGSKINVGSEIPTSIFDFATVTSNLARVPIEIQLISDGEFKHSPNQILVPTVDRLKSLGWKQHVPLEEGVRRTLYWIEGSQDYEAEPH